jgi:PelA/Pel-15E family pectate lyase
MIGARRVVIALTLAVVLPTGADARAAAQSAVRTDDSLLSAERIAMLPISQRAAWKNYLARSARLQQRDRDTIAAELRALGRSRMVPAPDVRASFTLAPRMQGAWLETDSARALAEAILSYQTPSGGWSKHMDFTRGPRPAGTSFFSENDGWNFIATIDNNSTTEEIRFLARAHERTGDARYRKAVDRGLAYLLVAQYPNGCWPQVYPLGGGYHDAATFNDDATINVLNVLRELAPGRDSGAVKRGVECILATQVVVAGKRTIWGQQHDPLTLTPVGARSYEHASLASRESAGVVDFLMRLEHPDPRVIEAVHSAADWFKANAKHGVAYDWKKGVVETSDPAPVWARMSEIGTNRPIFSNRDGIVLYDYHQLTDRKTGYAWFSTEPAAVLAAYEAWAKRYPSTAPESAVGRGAKP